LNFALIVLKGGVFVRFNYGDQEVNFLSLFLAKRNPVLFLGNVVVRRWEKKEIKECVGRARVRLSEMMQQ
jgi:hypothetical protein